MKIHVLYMFDDWLNIYWTDVNVIIYYTSNEYNINIKLI